jgi:5-methylcytosine-specific restriction endonuclease McrA
MPRAKRPDHDSVYRSQFESNKRKIYATQTICGICGQPVDFSKKFPDPMSPCIDHIIPIDKGGHPSELDNLQLAHLCCNRQKSDKLVRSKRKDFGEEKDAISNRILPLSMDWSAYHS